MQGVNFEVYEIPVDEWLIVRRGFIMVCSCEFLICEGYIEIEGFLEVDHDH
jgi:hypothetical protein